MQNVYMSTDTGDMQPTAREAPQHNPNGRATIVGNVTYKWTADILSALGLALSRLPSGDEPYERCHPAVVHRLYTYAKVGL